MGKLFKKYQLTPHIMYCIGHGAISRRWVTIDTLYDLGYKKQGQEDFKHPSWLMKPGDIVRFYSEDSPDFEYICKIDYLSLDDAHLYHQNSKKYNEFLHYMRNNDSMFTYHINIQMDKNGKQIFSENVLDSNIIRGFKNHDRRFQSDTFDSKAFIYVSFTLKQIFNKGKLIDWRGR